ncbi:NAD(P)H-binding protein [Nocardia puris]|uniref:Putative NAD(P)-binding protein n=1 Tax=Nocardia puris TaxID=208602 RepID=A0A366DUW9_9NOCA|nr:NAD(P)H-binding protein [Nocardia puris]MBF6210457.1 NAD(P)H-binding protein [Nocardia puris]MBF6367532.1 NAD(P)H-binding protein [Nocardia puris]MBF6457717.1 NAD(P)H-binding protein [Nocardia puris]RBO93883.1 putative NAD(P)-binding protein [Nocardia puris]
MHVVTAGGHGKIALLLAPLLTAAGHSVDSLIRNPAHAPDVEATGARPVLLDLEHAEPSEVAAALRGADAAVFAAGAGPGSGVERKYTVDKGGSVALAEAAESAGVRRFVQISAMGTGLPPAPGSDEVWIAYLDAKTQAEEDLRARDLDWTILRPGRLVDTPGTGLVTLTTERAGRADVPRADVAAVLAAVLTAPGTTRTTLELVAGATPVADAVAAIGN